MLMIFLDAHDFLGCFRDVTMIVYLVDTLLIIVCACS